MKLSKKLTKKLEAHDFTITYESDGDIYFGKYSPAGQDFGFSVNGNNLDELASNIYSYYEGYDVSYEAYIWLDDTGHGKNGAPYDMKDVYEDMMACEEIILELYNLIMEA